LCRTRVFISVTEQVGAFVAAIKKIGGETGKALA
jgi:hypothetical protein